jgi:hypothetical protein
MVEKTIESLEAELEKLKKQNLEREIAIEQAKAKEAEELKKKEDEEKLREEIREQVLKELKPESKIETIEGKKPTTLEAPWKNEFVQLSEDMSAGISKDLGQEVKLTGDKYEDFITRKFPKQWTMKDGRQVKT